MAAVIPRVITPSSASGAEVIDGSLRFNRVSDSVNAGYLIRTFTVGNSKQWTLSAWIKRDKLGITNRMFGGNNGTADNTKYFTVLFGNPDYLRMGAYSSFIRTSNALYRDVGWYHLVVNVDIDNASSALKYRAYINNEEVIWSSTGDQTDTGLNRAGFKGYIGAEVYGTTPNNGFGGNMTQYHFLDGLSLGPGYFGYNDPLTNVWRPKAFKAEGTTVNDGTTWSSGTTNGSAYSGSYTWTTTFNGNPMNSYGATESGTSANPYNIAFPDIPFSSLTLYTQHGGANGIWVNGIGVDCSGNVSLGSGADSQTVGMITFTAEQLGFRVLSQIGVNGQNRWFGLAVDGVLMVDSKKQILDYGANGCYLPMDGNTPIGLDQSGRHFGYSNVMFSGSDAWHNGTFTPDNAFDGTPESGTYCEATSDTITWAPVGLSWQTSLEVMCASANMSAALDGGGSVSLTADTWTTVSGSADSIDTSLIISRASSAQAGIKGIRIDGVILVDGSGSGWVNANNWTPSVFGGSNVIPKATGALPILNTVSGGRVAGVGVRTDTSGNNCVLALPLVGVSSDYSNKINSGSTTKVVTVNNAVASSTYSNFYGGSYYFDGTGDYLSIPNTTDVNFGSGDFTVECWAYFTSVSAETLVGQWENGSARRSWLLQVNSGVLSSYLSADGSTSGMLRIDSASGAIVTGRWYHLAFGRSSNTMRMFIDGVLVGTDDATGFTNYANTDDTFQVGSQTAAGSNLMTGYIQDVRIYKGVGKYTSDFIPASTDPDILPATPSGVALGSELTKVTDGAVSFDGTGDYLQLADSADFDMGTGDFTLECWVNSIDDSDFQGVFGSGDYDNDMVILQINNAGLLRFTNPSTIDETGTTDLQNSGWHHIVMCRSGTTLKGFVDGREEISTTYSSSIDWGHSGNSIVIGTVDLTDYPGQYQYKGHISNLRLVKGTALYTSNFTPPTEPLTNVTNTKLLCCQSPSNVRLSPVAPTVGTTANTRFNSNFETIPTTVNGLTVTNNSSVSTTSAGTNDFGFTNCADLSGSNSLSVDLGAIPQVSTYDIIFKVTGTTNNKYLFAISNTGITRRSGSSLAWYNNNADQVLTTTPDDGNWHHLRVTPTRLYFDGAEIVNTTTTPNIYVSSNGYMALGAYRNDSGTIQYNGEVDIGLVRVMPGVDLGPPTIPITTNGTLSSTETIPVDGVIFAAGNVAATTSNPFTDDIDTVMGQGTRYITLNPLRRFDDNCDLSNGNLTATGSSDTYPGVAANISLTSGKWYYEFQIDSKTSNPMCGVIQNNYWSGGSGRILYRANGDYVLADSSEPTDPSTFDVGDVIGVVIDLDDTAGYIRFYKNGALEPVISGLNDLKSDLSMSKLGGLLPYIQMYTNDVCTVNFGQKPFKYAPPEGHQPLNYANLPSLEVLRPADYVGISTWTGAGNTDDRIIPCSFQPDLIWSKTRNHAYHNNWFDSVRGFGASNALVSDLTSAAGGASGGRIKSVDENGITWEDTGGGYAAAWYNESKTYVSWYWKAGGNKNTFNVDDVGYATAAAAGLTGTTGTGAVLLGASVGTKQGFSIIKGTMTSSGGGSWPHGLGQKPDFMILKNLDDTSNWMITQKDLGTNSGGSGGMGDNYLMFTDDDNSYSSGVWGGEPTTSLFSLGTSAQTNSDDFIMYLWHNVPGLQKFGYYTGNGDADGIFVDLGFRPALLIIKRYDSGSSNNWQLTDAKCSPFNVADTILKPDESAVEGTHADYATDFLSNGFKQRTGHAARNLSGKTYMYAAWAEQPMNNLYGAQSNAR